MPARTAERLSQRDRLTTRRALAPQRGAAVLAEPVAIPPGRTAPRARHHEAFIPLASPPVHGPRAPRLTDSSLPAAAPESGTARMARYIAAAVQVRSHPNRPDGASAVPKRMLCACAPIRPAPARRARNRPARNHLRRQDAAVTLGYSESDHQPPEVGVPGALCLVGQGGQGLVRAPQNPHKWATWRLIPTGIPRTKRHTPVH